MAEYEPDVDRLIADLDITWEQLIEVENSLEDISETEEKFEGLVEKHKDFFIELWEKRGFRGTHDFCLKYGDI